MHQTPEFQAALQLLRRAEHMVVLTGAGYSTPSGIPDFRSPQSGLWERYNPAEVASLYGFRLHPERFYDWMRPLARLLLEAEPNAAHYALAQLEARGKLSSVITQNIDMLHTRAGSQTVYELHGHLREMTCIHCFASYPAETYITHFLENGALPRCEKCGHVLKPDVILFGEQLPAHTLAAARREARQCDVMLVAGSSLEVYPAAELPAMAQHFGATVILVNLTPTAFDPQADVVLHADIAEVIPQLVEALETN